MGIGNINIDKIKENYFSAICLEGSIKTNKTSNRLVIIPKKKGIIPYTNSFRIQIHPHV